jgi:hypothetical protein
VTEAGATAGLTPATLGAATARDIARYASEGKLANASEALPAVAGMENAGVSARLEPEKTYVVTVQDNRPGGSAFRARAFTTVLDTLPQDARGELNVRYDDPNAGTVEAPLADYVEGGDKCIPRGREFMIVPRGLDTRLETRVDADGIGQPVDAADPFAADVTDADTALTTDRETFNVIQYFRRQGSSATMPNRTYANVRTCVVEEPGNDFVTPPVRPAEPAGDAFVGVRRMPGDSADGEQFVGSIDYFGLGMRRPTSGNVADIETDNVRVSGLVVPVRAGGFGLILGLDYTHTDGDVSVGGNHVQDITGDMVSGAAGVEYRLSSTDLRRAVRAYLMGRGFYGDGETETGLPPAMDGTPRSLQTERDYSGLGVEGGVALRLGRFAFEADGSYHVISLDENAALSGMVGGEDTTSEGRYLLVSGHAGLRFGKAMLIGGAAWSHEEQESEINGHVAVYDNLRLDLGLRNELGRNSNLLMVGYDPMSGVLRLYDRFDLPHFSVYGAVNVPLDGERDNVRMPTTTDDAPYVQGGLEFRFK